MKIWMIFVRQVVEFQRPRPRRNAMSKITDLVARCNDGTATLNELEVLYAHDREVKFDTFFRHVDLRVVSDELGYTFGPGRNKGLRMRNDYHVRYYRSRFRGRLCWYIDWSSIDHIFQPLEAK